jgi:hypothetical protein
MLVGDVLPALLGGPHAEHNALQKKTGTEQVGVQVAAVKYFGFSSSSKAHYSLIRCMLHTRAQARGRHELCTEVRAQHEQTKASPIMSHPLPCHSP